MVNTTARVIDKKELLGWEAGKELTNTQVLLFITQSKYWGEGGLLDAGGHL